MFSLESMSVNSWFFDKYKFHLDSLKPGIMVSEYSITYIKYIIVKDVCCMYMSVNLDCYKWRNDDGVNLWRRILDWIGDIWMICGWYHPDITNISSRYHPHIIQISPTYHPDITHISSKYHPHIISSR